VGFGLGHWVTNARTLPKDGPAHNARGVNVWWTKGELAAAGKADAQNVS
jgi:membrane-bound inhibitor of C-type lysozyme